MKKVDLIIDLQYGSTGKGLIAGYLAETNGYDTVINANMPNAGHTYINVEGRMWMHKVLPNGIVSPNLKRVMIGAGSVFSIKQLQKEIEGSKDLLDGVEILIHPNAVVLQDEHSAMERNNLSRISSTMQGSMAATIAKMMRDPENNPTAAGEIAEYGHGSQISEYVCTIEQWHHALMNSTKILAEGAQGYSLGLNGKFWPFCTSRDCTPARFMADMAIPLPYLNKVIGTARCHPIRVGNTADGYSGDVYSDQVEISFEQLGQETELTTVTKRPRRIFSYSSQQMKDAIFDCMPDEVFLNFCNYTDTYGHIVHDINITAERIMGRPVVRYLGFGAAFQNIKDKLND
ncbi:adenylosuccinate synthetase [Candidatus Babeliales bacterium]|nr:adenylosuccinate synthetase [Candidatus Babeliales bacterium]